MTQLDSSSDGSGAIVAAAVVRAGDVLAIVVENSFEFMSTRHASNAADAWPGARDDLNELVGRIRSASEEQLAEAGLTGVHLEMKVEALAEAGDRVRTEIDQRQWPRARKYFVRFAAWLNSFLCSVTTSVPGAGEILKEFKEYLENSAEDRILQEEEDGPNGPQSR